MDLWALRLWFKGIIAQWLYVIRHTPKQLRPKLLSLLFSFPAHHAQHPQNLLGVSLRLAPLSLSSLGAPELRAKPVSLLHGPAFTRTFTSVHWLSKS